MEFFRTKWGTIVTEKNEIVTMDMNNSLFREYELWSKSNEVRPTNFMTNFDIEEDNRLLFFDINAQQFEELSSTDWYLIRKIDTGEEIPEEVIKERKEIRDKFNLIKEEIKNNR